MLVIWKNLVFENILVLAFLAFTTCEGSDATKLMIFILKCSAQVKGCRLRDDERNGPRILGELRVSTLNKIQPQDNVQEYFGI